ncbi:protein ECT2-like [Limulus polyphemus]|uniref:Protein ECT2-like n=1 Tax=Limulus polyphemus TaxID=6850 RepID=A0ABM1S4H8_LIMPO|nr:protein ECT2-like [Limulus polyphemus]XP_022238534.1 protein ECT2-like [Limulus polyphemus]
MAEGSSLDVGSSGTGAPGILLDSRICIIGEKLKDDKDIIKAAESFQVPVVCSPSGKDILADGKDYDNVFVLDEFEGQIYDTLVRSGQRILGSTALIQFAEANEPLPYNTRPLYTTSMRQLILCFTGFRKKEDMCNMATLIHHMGGSIRKDFNTKITHLVANSTAGEKYRYAANLGIPIMREDWIYKTWEKRHEKSCLATDESLMELRLQPFFGCRLTFLGFQEDEKKHMEEITVQNGGQVTEPSESACSHVVVEDMGTSPVVIPDDISPRAHVVKMEWFWASIQMDACADESIYIYKVPIPTTPLKGGVTTLSISCSRGYKRKRHKESVAHQLALEVAQEELDPLVGAPEHKRRSSERASLSVSGSFLDATFSPDFLEGPPDIPSETLIKSPIELKSMTNRQQVCMELLQTETNYVGILSTIVTLFKEPLEQPDQVGGSLLDATETKIIFGNLPPIFEVHKKIREELATLMQNWKEEHSIGNLILQHSSDLMRAYPPFVNFFEKTKEMLLQCDKNKPRFHAFLKRCQSKPECGRQNLVELLIRPVQRLPSVVLLLNDILKHTNKSNPDHEAVDKAIRSLKEVMMHINEDKRKTEGQVAMFDIINDIENCPAHLLSSHRSFVTRADTQELGDSISRRGDTITMFLFTDMLEICKRRSRGVGAGKSPGLTTLSAAGAGFKSQQKCFKHLQLMPLPHIKRVVDIKETDDCKNTFALVVRSNQELKERLYTFILLGEDVDKGHFLRLLCRHMANAVCRADAENFLTSLEPQQLAIETSDISSSTLTRAIKAAYKTREKIGRALSTKRNTPGKRGLTRAVSSIISPLRSRATPTSSLKGLRLASTTNLTELGNSSLATSTASLPVTPMLGKKVKSASLGPATSKYL